MEKKPPTAGCEAARHVNAFTADDFSVTIRLRELSVVICDETAVLHTNLSSVPLKRPIKSLLGNMTHVVRSLQPLHYSNKQLLFVRAQLDSQTTSPFLPLPGDNGVGSHLFLKKKKKKDKTTKTFVGWICCRVRQYDASCSDVEGLWAAPFFHQKGTLCELDSNTANVWLVPTRCLQRTIFLFFLK